MFFGLPKNPDDRLKFCALPSFCGMRINIININTQLQITQVICNIEFQILYIYIVTDLKKIELNSKF